MTENLTACRDCKWLWKCQDELRCRQPDVVSGPETVPLKMFDPYAGYFYRGCHAINTDGHCEYFKEKEK